MQEQLNAYKALYETAKQHKEHLDYGEIERIEERLLKYNLCVTFNMSLQEAGYNWYEKLLGYGCKANVGLYSEEQNRQISGVVQVTEMAKDDLKEVFTAAITAREGEDGSKAIFKMVTESNPNVDPSLYREVQRVVQATKKEYQSEQTAFLMQKANYKEALGTVWGGWWLKTAGYPKVDPDSYKIVVTGKASTALQTGVEEEIVLRPKK